MTLGDEEKSTPQSLGDRLYQPRTVRGKPELVTNVALTVRGQGQVAQSTEDTIKVWDRGKGTDVLTMPGLGRYAAYLEFTPDGKALAAGSGELVRLFDIQNGAFSKIALRDKDSSGLRGFTFSPDGGRIAGGSQFDVFLWELPGEDVLWRFKVNEPLGVAFAPDGLLLAVADGEDVVVLEAASGRPVARLRGHDGQVYEVAFLPDGRRLVSGSADTTGLVWDLVEVLNPCTEGEHSQEHGRNLAALWSRLADLDPMVAYAAAAALVRQPTEAINLVRKMSFPTAIAPAIAVPAATKPASINYDALIVELADPDVKRREAAHKAIERAGKLAVPAVSKALINPPTGEAGERLKSIARLIGARPAVAAAKATARQQAKLPLPAPSRDARVVTLLKWLTADADESVVKEARELLEHLTNAQASDVAMAARNALRKSGEIAR